METIKIKTHCDGCNKDHYVLVKKDDYVKYKNGALAQNAFPYLSPAEREMLITGICDVCWKKMFGSINIIIKNK